MNKLSLGGMLHDTDSGLTAAGDAADGVDQLAIGNLRGPLDVDPFAVAPTGVYQRVRIARCSSWARRGSMAATRSRTRRSIDWPAPSTSRAEGGAGLPAASDQKPQVDGVGWRRGTTATPARRSSVRASPAAACTSAMRAVRWWGARLPQIAFGAGAVAGLLGGSLRMRRRCAGIVPTRSASLRYSSMDTTVWQGRRQRFISP
jgi:hypothetical protein